MARKILNNRSIASKQQAAKARRQMELERAARLIQAAFRRYLRAGRRRVPAMRMNTY